MKFAAEVREYIHKQVTECGVHIMDVAKELKIPPMKARELYSYENALKTGNMTVTRGAALDESDYLTVKELKMGIKKYHPPVSKITKAERAYINGDIVSSPDNEKTTMLVISKTTNELDALLEEIGIETTSMEEDDTFDDDMDPGMKAELEAEMAMEDRKEYEDNFSEVSQSTDMVEEEAPVHDAENKTILGKDIAGATIVSPGDGSRHDKDGEIIRLYTEQAYSVADIHRASGLSSITVTRILSKHNVELRNIKIAIASSDRADIRARHSAGDSISAIAFALGYGYGQIDKLLHGVSRTPAIMMSKVDRKLRRAPLLRKHYDQICELLHNGRSQTEIYKELGISLQVVREAIKLRAADTEPDVIRSERAGGRKFETLEEIMASVDAGPDACGSEHVEEHKYRTLNDIMAESVEEHKYKTLDDIMTEGEVEFSIEKLQRECDFWKETALKYRKELKHIGCLNASAAAKIASLWDEESETCEDVGGK